MQRNGKVGQRQLCIRDQILCALSYHQSMTARLSTIHDTPKGP